MECHVKLSTRHLRFVALFAATFWIITTLVAIIARWPHQFGGAGNPNNVALESLTSGTALSAPMTIIVPTILFALVIGSRRWWGTLAAIGLVLIGGITLIGGLGEAFAPATPDVPRAVLIACGVMGSVVSPALLITAVCEVRTRLPGRHHPELA